MSENKIINDYKKHKNRQENQRLRGINDYNILTAVLSHTDEVRLHSGFIYSLINPRGSHFQGFLFLEMFLNAIGFGEEFDYDNAFVEKEYNFIDLYITDMKHHIIIENKIYAGDQDGQISNYISTVKSEKRCTYDKIFVYYLSIDRVKPGDASISGYKIEDNYLIDTNNGDKKIFLKLIHYDKHIVSWLNSMLDEVSNLENLHFSIKQYF